MAWFLVIAAVLVAHLLLVGRVIARWGGARVDRTPRRIDVSLVKQLKPSAPPVALAPGGAPLPPPRSERAVRPARAASSAAEVAAAKAARQATAKRAAAAKAAAAQAAASAAAAHEALLAQALALAAAQAAADAAERAASAASPETNAGDASSTSASASTPDARPIPPAAAAASAVASAASASAIRASSAFAQANAASAAAPFRWPPSTRLTYTLTGRYHNQPIFGAAAVEWRRDGAHYQVEFSIRVPPFFEQRMSSDGQITDDGLRPRHYDESFKVPLVEPRLRHIEFGDQIVTLNNGNQVPRLPQSQDSASQFVQFVWMFATHPQWLQPGAVIGIPLALPNNLRRWNYQVGEPETLALKFGALDAIHLKPILDGPRKSNEYPFEIWTAPTLQYLPVRIRVLVDDHNYANLSVDSLPLQADDADPTGSTGPTDPPRRP